LAKKYIQKLIDVFSTLNTNIKLHFIIATHSPFIISDLPSECIIKLEWNWQEFEWEKFTKISYQNNQTFWANFVDLIRDWFFFKEEALMWSFSENVIGDIAEKRRKEITNDKKIENLDLVKNIENKIWDDFLRDNLLYFKKGKND
jgi:hypothetical protein